MFNDKKKGDVIFNDIKHFLAPKLYLFLGKDKFYPSFNGYVGHVRMHLCDGSFNPEFPIDPPGPPIAPS
jgi:hypothetical protein